VCLKAKSGMFEISYTDDPGAPRFFEDLACSAALSPTVMSEEPKSWVLECASNHPNVDALKLASGAFDGELAVGLQVRPEICQEII
jgi:hypothetical protein